MTQPACPSATILDVARLAGVSRTTVSRVLNQPERVSAETLERVRSAASRLNYSPNPAARSLRSGRTGTIALLVSDIAQPYHGSLAKAVSQHAQSCGMRVVLTDLDRDERRLVEMLERLTAHDVDGLIIATSIASEKAVLALRSAADRGVATVIGIADPRLEGIPAVRVDYAEIARRAVAHLVAGGATRPALIAGIPRRPHALALGEGFAEAVRTSGLEPGPVLFGGYDFHKALEQVARHLNGDHRVDAFVTASVPMALGAIRAVRDRGLRVPDDIAVVSCEAGSLARQVSPSVTTVAVDPDALGAEMIRLVRVAIDGVDREPVALSITVTGGESTRN